MRFFFSHHLSFWLLALLFSLWSCRPLEPSGRPRPKPDATGEDGTAKKEDPSAKEGEHDGGNQSQNRDPTGGGDVNPVDPDPVGNQPNAGSSWSLLVKAYAPGPATGVYQEAVKPMIERSCLAFGCHANPNSIDLRTYPFAAEGSYTMDKIVAALGEDYDRHEAQKMIAAEIADAMATGYMPPAGMDVPDVSADEKQHFQTWIDQDLKIDGPTFVVTAVGDENGTVVCQKEITFSPPQTSFSLDSTICPGLTTLRLTLTTPDGGTELAKVLSVEELENATSVELGTP